MKRFLIRSGINPLETADISEIMILDLLGGNSGNLIYSNSLFRSLMVDDTVAFACDKYLLGANDADWINENFDSYIIPLADLFRPKNDREINRMKSLVKKLTIPCIIIGVGIRANSKKEIENGFAFDDTAKEFIDAVLEKSAIIGIRGEITAKYFKKLGYAEDRDFMIIGCLSMYTYGNKLKRKALLLNSQSKISVNENVLSSGNTLNFLNKILDDYPNSYFLPQRIDELWTLYAARKYAFLSKKPMYPNSIESKIYSENRVKMFLNAKQWMDFLKTTDLSIGSRLHGNIAAIQAGTPSIIIPHGARMAELVDYHKLPHISQKNLEKCKTLHDVIEQVDFESMYKCHSENFARYKAFLKMNGLDTIFNNSDYVENAPYDIAMSRLSDDFEVKSAAHISNKELAERWSAIHNMNNLIKTERQKQLREKLSEVNSQFKMLNKSSIRTDIKRLSVKVANKIKGEKQTNLEVALKVKNRNKN